MATIKIPTIQQNLSEFMLRIKAAKTNNNPITIQQLFANSHDIESFIRISLNNIVYLSRNSVLDYTKIEAIEVETKINVLTEQQINKLVDKLVVENQKGTNITKSDLYYVMNDKSKPKNEAIKIPIDKSLESEVSRYRQFLQVGDIIFWLDADNSPVEWAIIELFDGGFVANDIDVNEESTFFYDSLQKGWYLSQPIKDRIEAVKKNRKYQDSKTASKQIPTPTINHADYLTKLFDEIVCNEPCTIYYKDTSIMSLGITTLEVKGLKITQKQYAQYPNAIKVEYVAKNKRKPDYFFIASNPFIFVIKGYGHKFNEDIFDDVSETYDTIVKKSRYSAYDDRWVTDLTTNIDKAISTGALPQRDVLLYLDGELPTKLVDDEENDEILQLIFEKETDYLNAEYILSEDINFGYIPSESDEENLTLSFNVFNVDVDSMEKDIDNYLKKNTTIRKYSFDVAINN